MNRVINDPDQVVEDMLRGILVAHPELRQYESNPRVIVKAKPSAQGRVGIVTDGGSGHEPAFLGYVGPGLVDAVDAFCEHLAFSPAQVERLFIKARELGLPVKLHAEQL